MAGKDTAAPGPSSPSTSAITKYEVFLSFRGKGVGNHFASHLYEALYRQGIHTFKDNEDLGRGQLIPDKVRQAIVQSQIAIVLLSKSYFSSWRCLEELVTIINSSRSNQGQIIVVPVFYGIDPSHIRRQRGSLAAAFEEHEARCSVDTVRRWREASAKIAD
ncbi:toll/interleukin-1 receptor-like protein [Neltuma alba]|uniref:toll/interleukin-1 receptor-like protein n=1 Tax=Neltuma alba TaxID=207710 RepID=UPI0010A45225|nr:toll/interleukin-1 receptor-like protein [Prosopis alba]